MLLAPLLPNRNSVNEGLQSLFFHRKCIHLTTKDLFLSSDKSYVVSQLHSRALETWISQNQREIQRPVT